MTIVLVRFCQCAPNVRGFFTIHSLTRVIEHHSTAEQKQGAIITDLLGERSWTLTAV